MMSTNELETAFRAAYFKKYNQDLREFRRLDANHYVINGIRFNENETRIMLATLEQELIKDHASFIKRLIRFFGGKQPT